MFNMYAHAHAYAQRSTTRLTFAEHGDVEVITPIVQADIISRIIKIIEREIAVNERDETIVITWFRYRC